MDRHFQATRKRLLRLVVPTLKWLPPRQSSEMVAQLGALEHALNAGLRQRYRRAVERATRHFQCHWDVPAVARQLAANSARWLVRDRLLDSWSDERVNGLFDVEGRQHLNRALHRDKGVVLLFSHFGAHVHPTHWLMRQGHAVRWFTERPKMLSRYIQQDFATDGPTGQDKMFISRRATAAAAATAILRARRSLSSGMIVKAAGDVRWTGPRTTPGTFLGRTYTFTTPWVSLAALSGAPVVPVFCLMRADGSFQITFVEPYEVPAKARDADEATPWLQGHLTLLESWLRRHPDNSNEYFFWYESNEALVEVPAQSEAHAA
jgi:KDO2-lipid IV(A) lauroyltransferase